MTFIPFERAVEESRKDPEYVRAYNALEEEFQLAEELIKSRIEAKMTQEQVACAMGASQNAVSRIESGRSSPKSIRRYARATGKKVVIRLE